MRYAQISVSVALALCVAACQRQPPPPAFRTTATVKDIMDSMIDPSADAVWDSVAIVVSASGIEERHPRTEEEWAVLRRQAVQLVEATNLLLMPNRQIARPGERAANPEIELGPEAIQALVDGDRGAWTQLVHGLHDAALPALRATEARDPKGLMAAGEAIDKACESCHAKYWYPEDRRRAPQAAAAAAVTPAATAPHATSGGVIKGSVRLAGQPPGNPIIRMGLDPMCVAANGNARVVQESVVVAPDGGLANVFVRLRGTFPSSALPSEPVVIAQRGCVYGPRVVGARVGQKLQIRNDDNLMHNVHGVSADGNGFDASEPQAGMALQFDLTHEEVMLPIKCDVHRWMRAYVGVVNHPYFAVSGREGTFEIDGVPLGTYTIEAWHERYGRVEGTVTVAASGAATVALTYRGESST